MSLGMSLRLRLGVALGLSLGWSGMMTMMMAVGVPPRAGVCLAVGAATAAPCGGVDEACFGHVAVYLSVFPGLGCQLVVRRAWDKDLLGLVP